MHRTLALLLLLLEAYHAIRNVRMSTVRVFDGIQGSSIALDFIDECSTDKSHYYFDLSEPTNRVEGLLDNILGQLDDYEKGRHIEYWWRQDWFNLEMHRDVDENLARSDNEEEKQLRYPKKGHILYLDVGEQVENGATFFFCHDSQNFDHLTDLVTVPAISNRLVQFQGDIYHSVPRPSLAYFEPYCFEIFTRKRNEQPVEFRRSVILFNTWDEPPLDVSRYPVDIVGGGIECKINTRETWTHVDIYDDTTGASSDTSDCVPTDCVPMKIGLLGDKFRRKSTERYWRPQVKRHVLEDPELLLHRTRPMKTRLL